MFGWPSPTAPGGRGSRPSACDLFTHPGRAFTEGIEVRDFPGGRIRIYNPAKTVADTFKFRNKVGLDVALEALRDCLRSRKATRDELWHYAEICRVQKIMKPYMEALS